MAKEIQGRRIKRGWMNMKVTKVVRETLDTVTIFLEDAEEGGRQFDYLAGQYLTFRFDDIAPKPLVRSYTLSSSPCEAGFVAFTVKEIDDPYVSKFLCEDLQEGQILRARGPIGKFCYDPKSFEKRLVMIAAGSGVTPFVSIMREYQNRLGVEGSPEKMGLLVSYRSRSDIIFNELLQDLAKHSDIDVRMSLTREDAMDEGFWHGRIDAQKIKDFVGDASQSTFMLCGPIPVMDLAAETLKSMGVQDQNIVTESYES